MANQEVSPNEGMTPLFRSASFDAEMEAMAIKTLLDANGIPAAVVGPHVLPMLEFQVQVPEHLLARARQVIREARQGGRQAADEGEAATE
jgi:Putative prokaryotic signal transducing protein